MKERLLKFAGAVAAVVVGNYVYELLTDTYNEHVHDLEDFAESVKDRVDIQIIDEEAE